MSAEVEHTKREAEHGKEDRLKRDAAGPGHPLQDLDGFGGYVDPDPVPRDHRDFHAIAHHNMALEFEP